MSKSSPWEQRLKKCPDYSHLRIFYYNCFPWLKPYTQSKLDPKSKPCVFIGYNLSHKGYRCLDPTTNRIYISRHVHFDEATFPFHNPNLLQVHSQHSTGSSSPYSSPFSFTFPNLYSSSQYFPISQSTHISPIPTVVPSSTSNTNPAPIPPTLPKSQSPLTHFAPTSFALPDPAPTTASIHPMQI